MRRISRALLLLLLAFPLSIWSQSVTLKGTVYATADIEGIHVINKTLTKATTTDKSGTFTIQARENDTLVFSAIQYKLESIIVDKEMIDTKLVKVFLIESINQLDEVLVGKVLTGDLLSDIENSDAKPPINFYDVGIPGYKGRQKTQSERRLTEASGLSPKAGIGGSLSFIALINAISGRTKMLKRRVKLEKEDALVFQVKAKFAEDLFGENPLDESLHYEFFYFCSDDPDFFKKCQGVSGLETLAFLQEKLTVFKQQLKASKD